MPTSIKKTPKAPRAKMEGLAVKALQDALWPNRPFPKYMNKFAASAELMKVFKLLVHLPKHWENGLIYETIDIRDKLDHVFGIEYRHIFTYEVMEDFVLRVGEIQYNEDMPEGMTPTKLRAAYKGDIVLIRVDTRDEDLVVDLQILTSGIFQDTSDDFRNFKIDTIDIAQFRKYLKLVDKDGQDEENFISSRHRDREHNRG